MKTTPSTIRLLARALATAPVLALAPLASPATIHAQQPTLTEDLLDAFQYRLIGPANMSGRITAIAVPDTNGHKVMYIGTAGGGVWKTTNNGTTWRPIFNDQGFASIGDVAVAPSDHRVLWVGTGERNSLRSNGWGDGVYKSTNGGSRWEHVGLTETREIGRIAIHPTNPDIVWIAAMGHLWGANPERGVYKTTDGGASWRKVLFVDDTTAFVDLKLHPTDPDILYAAGWHRIRWGGGRMEGAGDSGGIWKSTDGGETWTELTDPARSNGLPTTKLGRIGIGVTPAEPDVVYAVMQVARGATSPSISPFGGLFKSEDAGATWTRVNDLSAVPDYYYNEVWTDPNDADQIWLAGTLLGHSTDGGRGIEEERLRRVHVDHHAMWVDPTDSDHIVLGNDGGIYISWDGGDTWEHQVIPISQFYEVDIDSTKVPYHVCGGTQDNGTWCGPSRTRESVGITDYDWYNVFGGDGFVSAVSADSPHIRYGESQYGNVSRFNTETGERTGLTPHAEDAGAEAGYEFRWDWDTPFVVSQHDPDVLYLGSNHLFRMTARGDDWEILGPDMTRANRFAPQPDSTYTSYHSLHSVAESALDARVLWTGSNDGYIWVSRDGGRTWTNVTDNIPAPQARRCWVAEIEPSHHDAATAFIAYDCHRRDDYRPYVFRTTDYGQSFSDLSAGLPEDAGSWVVRQSRVNPDFLWVGNERGVWVSNDAGASWVRHKANLPTAGVRDLELAPFAGDLVVGTFGHSIWVADVSALERLTPEVLASRAHLFPVEDARLYDERSTYGSFGDDFFTAENPPEGAVITYWLREDLDEDVRLTIKEVGDDGEAGETVQTLNGSGDSGIHRVTWSLNRSRPRPHRLGDRGNDRSTVDPGVYEVSLRVGEETLTQRITVEEGWVERMPGRVR